MIKELLVGLTLLNGGLLGFNDSIEFEQITPDYEIKIEQKQEIETEIYDEKDMDFMNGLTPMDDLDFRIVRAYLIDELTQTYLLTDGWGNFYELINANDYTGAEIEDGKDFFISVTNNKTELLSIIKLGEFTELETLEMLETESFIADDIQIGHDMFTVNFMTWM